MTRSAYNPVALAFLLIITLLLLLTSCNHKEVWMSPNLNYEAEFDISYDQEWEYTLPGAIDWEDVWHKLGFDYTYNSLRPGIPASLYLIAYDADHQELGRYSLESLGDDVQLPLNAESVLLFNSDTEFIIFDDLHNVLDAIATTRQKERSTLRVSPYAKNIDINITAPDVLYAAYLTHVHPGHDEEDFNESDYTLMMRPLVFTYVVRFSFDSGFEYVALARGALSGMASTVSMDNGMTGDTRCSVLFDAEVTDHDVVAIVKAFGTPDVIDDYFYGYGLNLEVRLTNGKILDFDFDITDQLRTQPRGGVIEVGGISISAEDGEEDAGAFDVEIEGWGEFEDIPIDINDNKTD